MTLGFGLLHRPLPGPTQHDWLRVLAVLLFCFAAVIAASLLLFDVVLRRRQIPRILQDLVQAVAYFIMAAIVLTRSDVDVTRVFTASVLTTAVIGLALQDTLGNIMAGLALQLERDFEVGDWINLGDRTSPIVGRIREVRWRATTIVTKNGDLMLIPNSAITRAMITNFSRPTTRPPAVGHRPRSLPPSAGAGARGDRGGGARAVVRAHRAGARLPAVGVPGGRLHLRLPLLDRRLPARRRHRQRRAQRHLVRAPPRRDGDPVPVAQRQRHRDERGPRRSASATRSTRGGSTRCRGSTCSARSTPRRSTGCRAGCARWCSARARSSCARAIRAIRSTSCAAGRWRCRSASSARTRKSRRWATVQFFGEMSLMTGETRTATVVAKSDVECYIVEKEAFQEIVAGEARARRRRSATSCRAARWCWARSGG